ncbi:MAG: 4'-phosphopantetheinyl transferase superfamily protein [Bacteroidota bacterium]
MVDLEQRPRLLTRDYDAACVNTWVTHLSDEERARWDGYRHARRRQSFLLGRVTARALLADLLDRPPPQVPIQVAEDGALEVPGTPYHLSLAHSGQRAVATVAVHPVGVDLEEIVPRRDDLYRYILRPDEYHLLDTLGLDRTHLHILTWTLKEATLKALRTGLRLSPKALKLHVEMDAQQARVTTDNHGHWHVRFWQEGGYYVSLAVPEAGGGPTVS